MSWSTEFGHHLGVKLISRLRCKARVDVLILDKWDLMKLSAKNERDLLAVRKDR